MNFAEFNFWKILLLSLIGIFALRWIIRPKSEHFDKCALLFLGLFLLYSVSGITFMIFLAVALSSYFGLKAIIKFHGDAPIPYLWVLIPLQLLPLLFYKYADFILHGVLNINLTPQHQWLQGTLGQEIPALRDLVIPVGISFYTFQKIAFVVDTLVFKQPIPKFLDYMNFAGFFPQIVAGPIERRSDLLPQMEQFRFRWNPEKIDSGASWIVLGFFFKCALADNLAVYFNPMNHDNAYLIWLANVLFGFRIYYDFAGYSFIALGLASCLGVTLTPNFASPYCSMSSTEFWRRWHVTLSQWFRDYIYIPLGGGRVKWWAFNVMLVFVVSGIWHGAGWGFILWGAMHGLFLVIHRLSKPFRALPVHFAWSLTFTASLLAWLCFYETRTPVLFSKLTTLLTPNAYAPSALINAFSGFETSVLINIGTLLAIIILVMLAEWGSIHKKNEAYYYLRRPRITYLLLVLTIALAPQSNNGFIYFAF